MGINTLLCNRTQSRGRTGTGVTPLVFETNASTDSAIWAEKRGKGSEELRIKN